MNKYSLSIKYGVIAGMIMIVLVMLIYFAGVAKLATMLPMIVYIPLIFLMIWGGITARRELGNYSGFGHAFLTVFIISFTATTLFDSFSYVLYKVIDPQIPVIIKQKVIENTSDMMEKFGASDDKTEEALKKIKDEDFSPTVSRELERFGMSAVVGAIFSVLIGLFVNRPDERPIIKAEE
jgi:ABC-type cobalt transport system substrate-binding protein